MICYWNFNLVHRPDDANRCRPGAIIGITNFLKLLKKTIINVLDKNIFIFVLIDRQFKKNCDCRIIMISNTVFIFKTHALK